MNVRIHTQDTASNHRLTDRDLYLLEFSNCKHCQTNSFDLVCFDSIDCNFKLQTHCSFDVFRLQSRPANTYNMSIWLASIARTNCKQTHVHCVCFIRISNRKQTHIHLVCFDWNFQLQIQCLFGVLQLESQTANKLVTSNKMRQTKFMNTESNEQIGMHCTAQHKLNRMQNQMNKLDCIALHNTN
eukprot:623206_1